MNKKKEIFSRPPTSSAHKHTWMSYRTTDHKCENRKQTNIKQNNHNLKKEWGECGPLEWAYEWLMGGLDGILEFSTDDMINTEILWNWFKGLLVIFFTLFFAGIIFKMYGIASFVIG